ncbi:MAG: hypothetical protein BA864_15710 [Desulfuromonadales bacterium C00003093]|nr:MAG: hypothetical protein BA864_15710 [Desulfuromonadales bacterium C00003093]
MKTPGLGKTAIDEIAREKTKILGEKYPHKSALERKAENVTRDFEYQKWIQSKPAIEATAGDTTSAIAFQEVSSVEFPKKALSHSVLDSWSPLKKKDEKEDKPISINTATVVAIRKKLMAMEWRRAKGITRPDPRMVSLEKEASTWKERREGRKRQEAEEKRRMEEQREQLQASLSAFGKKLYGARDNVTADMAVRLFEDAFDPIGEVITLTWDGDGCSAVIEPWEEKKRRRKERRTEPGLYELRIDQELNIASYEKIKDEKKQRAERTRHFLKPLMRVIREKSPQVSIKVLEDALSEAGRIAVLKRENEGWRAVVEPWEEMRVRNIERGGQPPIVMYALKFDTDLQVLGSRKVID